MTTVPRSDRATPPGGAYRAPVYSRSYVRRLPALAFTGNGGHGARWSDRTHNTGLSPYWP